MAGGNGNDGAATDSGHGQSAPSAWVRRFASLVPPGGEVLDLACGRGRHSRLFLESGHPVCAVDRDLSGLDGLAGATGLETIVADLEAAPWPLPGRRFACVVVTNYLWRPLSAAILAALAPGGVLLRETFAEGNEAFGKPRNPDHLLREGELLEEAAAGALCVLAYESGRIELPWPAVVQRICAWRPTEAGALPPWLPEA